MTTQHAVVLLERSTRMAAQAAIGDLFGNALHAPNFTGYTRRYEALDENAPDEGTETQLPRLRAHDVLQQLRSTLVEPWNLHATRDRGNMFASGTITIGDHLSVEDVPLVTLLALEKQLIGLRRSFADLPERDPSVAWVLDNEQDFWRSPEIKKARTKAVPKGSEVAPATKEHKAQVIPYTDNETVGHTVTTVFSGAITPREKARLLRRTDALINAVKAARADANNRPAETFEPAADLLGYLFDV